MNICKIMLIFLFFFHLLHEKRGISSKLMAKADMNIRIDYERSFRGSLPTASAVSIIAFHAANARKIKK